MISTNCGCKVELLDNGRDAVIHYCDKHSQEPDPTNLLRVLDLSTAHMTEDDASTMDISSVISHELGEYGWLVWTANNDPDMWPDYANDRSEAFKKTLERARLFGCHYILFDRDGPMDKELPVFDW